MLEVYPHKGSGRSLTRIWSRQGAMQSSGEASPVRAIFDRILGAAPLACNQSELRTHTLRPLQCLSSSPSHLVTSSPQPARGTALSLKTTEATPTIHLPSPSHSAQPPACDAATWQACWSTCICDLFFCLVSFASMLLVSCLSCLLVWIDFCLVWFVFFGPLHCQLQRCQQGRPQTNGLSTAWGDHETGQKVARATHGWPNIPNTTFHTRSAT